MKKKRNQTKSNALTEMACHKNINKISHGQRTTKHAYTKITSNMYRRYQLQPHKCHRNERITYVSCKWPENLREPKILNDSARHSISLKRSRNL